MECDGPVINQKGFLRVVDCEACGYAHLQPKPTQAALDRLYRREYYQTHNVGWFEKERREQWYWRRVYRQRWRYFEQAIKRPDNTTAASFCLDYGAGCGWFLKACPSIWYSAFGCEPNQYARNYALANFALLLAGKCGLDESSIWAFIHTSLVMEHLLDPRNFLQRAKNSLHVGGVICIIVPNEFNPLQRQLAARSGYSPLHPHHVNYWTIASLRRLVERSGFEVVRVAATFPMEWFALHGLDYVKHPKLGKLAHWARMAIEATSLTCAPDAWERRRDAWAAGGIGREVELWARKNG